MKKLISALVLALILAAHGIAFAYCTTQTIINPDGSITICQTCCLGNHCTTTCT